MNWTAQTLHFIDFEGSQASGIVEFGVVTLRGGRIEATATGLCAPTGRMRAEDIAVHRIDEALVAGRPLFSGEFERFCGLRESGLLAAHFANVENSLLKSVWPYPRTVPDESADRVLTEWGPWIDTGRIFPQLYSDLPTASLGELVELFGLRQELDDVARRCCPSDRCFYHAALYDALAGALLLLHLSRQPEVAAQPLDWLLMMSTRSAEKKDVWRQGNLF